MSRPFGKIASAIWNSTKFKALPDHVARMTYLYLHTCPHGNSIGAFRLPAAYVVADLRVDEAAAADALLAVQSVGLADYDPAEEIILIHGWWRHNPIANRKHLTAASRSVLDLASSSHIRVAAGILLARSALATSATWATDEKGHKAMVEVAEMSKYLLDKVFRDASDTCISKAVQAVSIPVYEQVCKSLSIPVSIYRDRDGDGYTDGDMRQRRETETNENALVEPISDIIDGLRAKAAQAPK